MNPKTNKILITGADGFIGSHLTEKLVKEGFNVRPFVFYNSFNSWGWLDTLSNDIKKSIDVYPGDIRDQDCVYQAASGCDVIMHLAALIAIPYSYRVPKSYIETNVIGTYNVLSAARHSSVARVVHTSTSEIYGTAKYVPIDEKHPASGQSPYSASKIAADQLAYSFYCSFDLPVVTIRPFNTYGPRQSARAIIPSIITQIANGCQELKLGSLSPTRDLSYVEDVVEAFIKVAGEDQLIGDTINIGSGKEISIGALVDRIAYLMKTDVKTISDTKRIRPQKSEVYRLCADITKAKKTIGYHPRHSLDQGLTKTIEWFSDRGNINLYKSDIYNI